jgi:hypothetical protein
MTGAANDLIMVDAAKMLSHFMRNGMPDAVRFTDATVPVIEQACHGRGDCVIRAYGKWSTSLAGWSDHRGDSP